MKRCPPVLAPSLLAILLLGAAPTRAAETAPLSPADSVLQQELKQQQLKTTTRKVGEQLEAIVAEFDRNGIQGEDVKVLRAIRSVLDRLSQQDMEKVIAFLQQTRAASDPAASARHATEAFAGQKTIIVQLQQLVLEYQRQQALYEMSLRLKELANRQTANMWLGVSLAKSTDGKSGFHTFDENQKISLRYQQSEQNPLKDEMAAILKKLEKLSNEIPDGPTAERPKAALQQAREGGLTPALEAAATELQENSLKLLSAIGNERRARDQMREVARLLLLSQDAIDALKQALQELDRAMDAQKKVTAETQTSKKKDETDRRAAEQAAVVDDTDLIRRDIDSLAPIASEHLKGAVAKMQDARESLEKQDDVRRRVEKAQPRQHEALAEMQQARHALEEQLAKAEELAEKPENALAALRELQKEVRELIKDEDAHRQETATAEKKDLPAKAPRQGELKDKAQELQARAATPSPEAASALGDAANQMQKAQNALAQQQNNSAAQQAALDALQKADEALGKDVARLEQAEKDLAKLEELSKRLAEVIQDQQKVQGATAKQAVKPQPEPQPTQELSQKQDKLGQETGALKQEAESPAPEAAPHLDAAQKQMADAKSQLDKPAAREAQPPQKQALNELYQAKNKLDKKIDELRDQLGLPPQNNDNLAQAQKAIEQAQQDVNNALSELQQAPPGLMDALQKQQQEIASSLHELRQDSPQAKPLAQAQQAANDAAQQLGQSDLPKAIESMKAAQNAMQQAKQSGQQQERQERPVTFPERRFPAASGGSKSRGSPGRRPESHPARLNGIRGRSPAKRRQRRRPAGRGRAGPATVWRATVASKCRGQQQRGQRPGFRRPEHARANERASCRQRPGPGASRPFARPGRTRFRGRRPAARPGPGPSPGSGQGQRQRSRQGPGRRTGQRRGPAAPRRQRQRWQLGRHRRRQRRAPGRHRHRNVHPPPRPGPRRDSPVAGREIPTGIRAAC